MIKILNNDGITFNKIHMWRKYKDLKDIKIKK